MHFIDFIGSLILFHTVTYFLPLNVYLKSTFLHAEFNFKCEAQTKRFLCLLKLPHFLCNFSSNIKKY